METHWKTIATENMTDMERLHHRRELNRLAVARYHQRHKAEISTRKKAHYQQNREKAIAATKAWQAKNPDRVRATAKARKDRNVDQWREDARKAVAAQRRKKREAGTPPLFDLPQNSPPPRAVNGPPAHRVAPGECPQPPQPTTPQIETKP